MQVTALYHPESDHARTVEIFARDYQHTNTGRKVELVSLDTREGADMARVYDIVQYPAIMVTAKDGQLLKVWQGEQLPLMNEVASYANS